MLQGFHYLCRCPRNIYATVWYSIKKVQCTDSYEFLLANKKCIVNADVFRTILDICPRVEGVDFIDVPDDDTTLAFLIKLGYKGPLYKHTNMFVDHMHHPWRTLEAIINKCLPGKTASNDKLCKSRTDILWGILIIVRRRDQDVKTCHFPDSPRLKFNTTCEDYHKYGLSIPETMLTEAIKQSKSYQMFIKYSSGQIPRGKGSQRKKTADDSQETVDISEESEPKPESVKRKTYSKRRVKKRVTLSVDDNNISDDPGAALKLGKSISKIEAKEAKAARQVHATHARIVTESISESTKKKSSGKNSKSVATEIMQALKESKKTSKRQSGTGGSNEGTGTKPGVPNEFTVISATSSEGTGTKPWVPDKEKDITKENVILEWGLKQESEYSEEDQLSDEEKDDKDDDVDDEVNDYIKDDEDADDEDAETKSNKDDIYKYKIRVHKDEDEEMLNVEAEDSGKGDEEVIDATKADVEKTSEVKDDAKKTELPPTRSSLSVSSGFGDQFLKLSSDASLVGTAKDITSSAALVTILPLPSVSTTPPAPQQTTTPIPTPPIRTDAPTITTVVFESNVLSVVQLRVAKLEKDISELNKIDLFVEALTALKIQVPSFQIPELPKKQTPTVDLEQESEKSPSEILNIKKEQAEKQNMPKNPTNHRLYHALMKALIEDENEMDKGVDDTVQDHKRKYDDDDEDNEDEDPPAGPNQGKQAKRRRTKDSESSKNPSTTKETLKGKALTKGSKTSKSASAKEPVEEPIAEVVMDDSGDDVSCDDDLPPGVYALVSNHKVTKELWERIQLLMQGTSLTKQERECKLYDEFDKFAYKKGETLRDFYLRFSLLLNDINIYNMKLEQFQVNTKFLNTLPPEWSKFVTGVKLVRDLHTTNIDQLHAYLGQHEFHANEVRLMHERNSDPLALVATHQMTQSPYQTHQNSYQNTQFQPQVSPYQSPQYGSPYQSQQYSNNQSSTPLSITYPSNDYQSSIHHNKGDDPIDAINHMMSFLTAVVTSRYPTTNNQLRNSSNPRQQATINNGRVTLQPIQGRQTSLVAGTSRTYTPRASGSNSGKQRTVICYNCKGEGHMSKQCTKPKRKRDDSWFKDKVLLVQAQASGQILHEEELAFLADPRILEGQATQTVMSSSEQSNVVNHSETEITSDNNIIPYSQYVIESQHAAV
ncbi:retrovirus-related pol polyprotein from transposon TNT 1-94 [Tanacetum coccineum]